jgi:hypothetical protein
MGFNKRTYAEQILIRGLTDVVDWIDIFHPKRRSEDSETYFCSKITAAAQKFFAENTVKSRLYLVFDYGYHTKRAEHPILAVITRENQIYFFDSLGFLHIEQNRRGLSLPPESAYSTHFIQSQCASYYDKTTDAMHVIYQCLVAQLDGYSNERLSVLTPMVWNEGAWYFYQHAKQADCVPDFTEPLLGGDGQHHEKLRDYVSMKIGKDVLGCSLDHSVWECIQLKTEGMPLSEFNDFHVMELLHEPGMDVAEPRAMDIEGEEAAADNDSKAALVVWHGHQAAAGLWERAEVKDPLTFDNSWSNTIKGPQ